MCASGSHLGAKTLLLLGISGTLKDILSGSSNSANLSVSPALSRPSEQVVTVEFNHNRVSYYIGAISRNKWF